MTISGWFLLELIDAVSSETIKIIVTTTLREREVYNGDSLYDLNVHI